MSVKPVDVAPEHPGGNVHLKPGPGADLVIDQQAWPRPITEENVGRRKDRLGGLAGTLLDRGTDPG